MVESTLQWGIIAYASWLVILEGLKNGSGTKEPKKSRDGQRDRDRSLLEGNREKRYREVVFHSLFQNPSSISVSPIFFLFYLSFLHTISPSFTKSMFVCSTVNRTNPLLWLTHKQPLDWPIIDFPYLLFSNPRDFTISFIKAHSTCILSFSRLFVKLYIFLEIFYFFLPRIFGDILFESPLQNESQTWVNHLEFEQLAFLQNFLLKYLIFYFRNFIDFLFSKTWIWSYSSSRHGRFTHFCNYRFPQSSGLVLLFLHLNCFDLIWLKFLILLKIRLFS